MKAELPARGDLALVGLAVGSLRTTARRTGLSGTPSGNKQRQPARYSPSQKYSVDPDTAWTCSPPGLQGTCKRCKGPPPKLCYSTEERKNKQERNQQSCWKLAYEIRFDKMEFPLRCRGKEFVETTKDIVQKIDRQVTGILPV